MSFSIVIPIKDEVELIHRCLPSYFELQPFDLVCCLDEPPDPRVVQAIWTVAENYPNVWARIITVPKDPAWKFHQAKVRRTGFGAASRDLILTGDIDLLVNKACLQAVNTLAHQVKKRVGLVSVSKFYYPHSFRELWQAFITRLLRRIKIALKKHGNFSGLYAFYRPYWRETEPEDILKQVHDQKRSKKIDPNGYCGEDTLLRQYMETRYRTIFLATEGGIGLRGAVSNDGIVQFAIGLYFASERKSVLGVLARTFMYLRPMYLVGYLWSRRHHT